MIFNLIRQSLSWNIPVRIHQQFGNILITNQSIENSKNIFNAQSFLRIFASVDIQINLNDFLMYNSKIYFRSKFMQWVSLPPLKQLLFSVCVSRKINSFSRTVAMDHSYLKVYSTYVCRFWHIICMGYCKHILGLYIKCRYRWSNTRFKFMKDEVNWPGARASLLLT